MNLFLADESAAGEAEIGRFLAEQASLEGSLGRMVLLLFFVLLNAFFVAAEFAIVKVRPAQLDGMLEKLAKARQDGEELPGSRSAGKKVLRAKRIVERPEDYLSACQLGITLASIGLGMVVEPLFAAMLAPALHAMGLTHPPLVHGLAVVVALTVVIYLHVVLGELIPKHLAFQRALPTALALAGPLHSFHCLFSPAIRLFNGTAGVILRRVFRIDPGAATSGGHSAEELRILVNEPGPNVEVTEIEREILSNALDLHDLTARKIMLARNDVVSLDISEDYAENYRKALNEKHTRYPLIDGHLDHTIGLIHVKDLMRCGPDAQLRLQDIAKPLEPVPERMPLDVLLKKFLEKRAHMALVVDEYGGSLGIVTLDNVLEELVGEIQDEFDDDDGEPDEFVRLNEDEFVVDGCLSLRDLAEETDLDLEDPEVDTVGGFVTHLLGRLPEAGEQVRLQDYLATVTETDGKVVGKVQFRRQAEWGEEGEEGEGERDKGAGEEAERILVEPR